MIEFTKVSKRYLGGFEALSQISFYIEPGEMVFLTGHSGAGKSTILKLITCLQPCTQGQIRVGEFLLQHMPSKNIPQLRRNIGMIWQDPQLVQEKTVFSNVALPLQIAGAQTQEITRKVRGALDKLGLLTKERLYPQVLSAGEQQRVAIARAIVNKPMLILADEPTGNLDPKLATEIMGLLAQFNQVGVTVLVASHDLALISKMKYRVLTLRQGRLGNG